MEKGVPVQEQSVSFEQTDNLIFTMEDHGLLSAEQVGINTVQFMNKQNIKRAYFNKSFQERNNKDISDVMFEFCFSD